MRIISFEVFADAHEYGCVVVTHTLPFVRASSRFLSMPRVWLSSFVSVQLYSCGSEPTFPFCSYRYRFIVQSLGASASRAAAAKAAIVP